MKSVTAMVVLISQTPNQNALKILKMNIFVQVIKIVLPNYVSYAINCLCNTCIYQFAPYFYEIYKVFVLLIFVQFVDRVRCS